MDLQSAFSEPKLTLILWPIGFGFILFLEKGVYLAPVAFHQFPHDLALKCFRVS
jgi:hypothetical protein